MASLLLLSFPNHQTSCPGGAPLHLPSLCTLVGSISFQGHWVVRVILARSKEFTDGVGRRHRRLGVGQGVLARLAWGPEEVLGLEGGQGRGAENEKRAG